MPYNPYGIEIDNNGQEHPHIKEECVLGYALISFRWHEFLIAGEEVAGVDAVGDIDKVGGGAVGEDGVGEAFELGEVVDHAGAEEC